MSSYLENFNFLTVLFSIIFIFSIFSRFSSSLSVNIVSFFIVSITFIFSFNSFKASLKNYLLPISLFVLFCIISYYFSDFKYNVRNEMFLLFSGSGMYLLIGFLKPEERTKVLIIPVLIGLLLTIYIFASLIPFSKVFPNKDTTSYISCVTCFLLSALSLSFAFWNEKKRIYICISFIFFIAILMVRSLFAVCIASFIFSMALLILGNKRKNIFSAVFALSGILSFYFLLKNSFFSEKFLIWKTALSVITDNFLLGVGFNNYKSVSLSYGTVENVDVLYCYNIFLQVLAETGIIGFVLFLALLFVFFLFCNKKAKL
jgi:hypothetical protein